MPKTSVASKKTAVQTKAAAPAINLARAFQLAPRLKQLREQFRYTQADMGKSGLVSIPGWIKIENGQRQPSEKLIENLCAWLYPESRKKAEALRDELLLLKYLIDPSLYVRGLALDRWKAIQATAAQKGGASK